MSLARWDLQAASGGRRNVPLVPTLVEATEWPGLLPFGGRHRKDPLAWANGMVAGENTWAWLAEISGEADGRPCLRIARIDLEAGTALGFNVNRDGVGSNL